MTGLLRLWCITLILAPLVLLEDVEKDPLITSDVEDEEATARGWAPALEGVWSPLLEEWAILARDHKVMKPTTERYIVNKPSSEATEGTKREVTETDLYLLGAIEKLVYRVDFMEKRLRRVEELLYHVMAGNSIHEQQDPCPSNFSRVGRNCYHFSRREYNWKTASAFCKTLRGNLAEFESAGENQDIIAYIQTHSDLRSKDYWTGGLNPGLLWIWSNSARPIGSNSTSDNSGINNIRGNGRCLKLAYNPPTRAYVYHGSDCSIKAYVICEYEENATSRALERIAKSLRDGKAKVVQNNAPVIVSFE
ncbi:oxidized low-density lipoprotein receptor 1 [Anabrus simplex]|uniref:oxidized low-density lipoprotein receptor 1 n=1 Tax=Anabrus simplex TaxID=316456 RepID=UPI0034DD33C8